MLTCKQGDFGLWSRLTLTSPHAGEVLKAVTEVIHPSSSILNARLHFSNSQHDLVGATASNGILQ